MAKEKQSKEERKAKKSEKKKQYKEEKKANKSGKENE
jgi:hypothetical protein